MPTPDKRALAWKKDNPWFGVDFHLTHFALDIHQALIKRGVDPESEMYYEALDFCIDALKRIKHKGNK